MTPTLLPGRGDVASKAVEDAGFRARRATIEDLPALQALWQRADLPWDQLEKYFTEFIVVPGENEMILAAVGIQVDGEEGLLHSEAMFPSEDADALRASLWERLQIVARNQGVARLWTLEDAPYWRSLFQRADPALSTKLKASFADPSAEWWMYQLVDPARAQKLLDERLALWEASRQAESTQLTDSIQRFRQMAFLVAGAVIVMMFAMVLYVFVKRPDALQRLLHGVGR